MATNEARRAHRWLAPAVVAGIAVAGIAGGFGQSSASPAPAIPKTAHLPKALARAAAKAADDPAAPTDKGPLPDPPDLLSGVIGLSTSARDTVAKVNLRVPEITGVAYLDPTYRTPPDQTIPAPKYNLPAHPKPGCSYREGILYADIYVADIRQPNPKKTGKVISVGEFPDSHVSALAFGSVPVTATLHTRQASRHGRLLPLTADTITAFVSVSKKDGSECDTDWEYGSQEPPISTVSHGELDVSVSDVRVDKQLVDVGPDCHTSSPLQLNLFGGDGYIVYSGGQLLEYYDPATVNHGGSVYPLHPGSTNLTIPPFVGCRNPKTGEDVSRLITAAVSGSQNTVAVSQSTAILNGITNGNVTLCADGQGCVKSPPFVNPPKPGMTVTRSH